MAEQVKFPATAVLRHAQPNLDRPTPARYTGEMDEEPENPYRSPLDPRAQAQPSTREPIVTDDEHLRLLTEIRDLLREHNDQYRATVTGFAGRQKRAAVAVFTLIAIALGYLAYAFSR